jgi:hypothetical protein
MEIRTHFFKSDEEQHIYHIGDIHAGIKDSDIRTAELAYEMAATVPNGWLISMGDVCEYREPGHPFYDSDQCTMDIDAQLTWNFRQFNKCKGRIAGVLMGNHERKLSRETTINPVRRWCAEHTVPYLGSMARINFVFPEGQTYSMMVHHGYGAGRKKGGKVNMLGDFIKSHDVDCVVIGHVHQLHDWIETELIYPNNHVKARYKLCGLSGTFLRTYAEGASGYAEERMMEPVPNGFLITHIHPERGIHMEKVLFG